MYINSGFLNDTMIDYKDKSKPIIAIYCGTYRLINRPVLKTFRPRGRLDYQLIYVASGSAHFHFNNETDDTVVNAGSFVLFKPKDFQKYEYYGADKPHVYWLHFTGGNVKNILRGYGIDDKNKAFYTGTSVEFENIFKEIIFEMQTKKLHYEENIEMLMHRLFIAIERRLMNEPATKNSSLDKEIEAAALYFNEKYNENISIEQYAEKLGMSVSWFIRSFKKYSGLSPMQYIVSARMINAQILLESTSYSVTEISHLVGYENPLYFSRLFRKHKGMSPRDYRKMITRQ